MALATKYDTDKVTLVATLPGDADISFKVDNLDFGALAGNWQLSGKTWKEGDFNGDGTVDNLDFGALAGNWQKTVPEPATLTLIGLGALALIRRRRR